MRVQNGLQCCTVAAALLAAACGGSSPRSTAGSQSSTPSSAASSSGTATSATRTAYTRALPVKVRVLNLYADSGTGAELDVWAGGEADTTSGRLLATVPYGHMSDPFVPYARKYAGPDNTTSSGQDVYGYELGFYLHGDTATADEVGDHSEDAYPGDLLTVLVAPSRMRTESGRSSSMRVVFDHLSSGRPESGQTFETASASGKALVWLVADGIIPTHAAPSDRSLGYGDIALDVAVGGKCLPETGPSLSRGSSRLLAGPGTGAIYFEVAPGTASLSVVESTGTAAPDCAGPATAEVPLGTVSAGDHLLVFVYGPDTHLESLVVPLMTAAESQSGK